MPQVFAHWPLNVCQMGQETIKGTEVPATTIWRGPFGSFEDNRKTEMIEEDIGTFARDFQEIITQDGVTIQFPSAALNLRQLPHILQASIGAVTPTGTGPYLRQYNAVFDDVDPALKSYTLRIGNKRVTADVVNIPYALVQEWELSGKQGELWKLSGTWTAPRRTTPGAFTPTVAIPAFAPVVFAKTQLWIDDGGGTIGATQKTGVLMAASIKYRTGIEWVPVGDGNLYAVAYKLGKPQIDFSFTYEVEQNGAASVVAAERAKYDSGDLRLFRLRLGGNETAINYVDIDFAGKYSKVGPYGKEGDSNTTVVFDGSALYSSVDSRFFGIKHAIENMATIP